MVQLQIRDDFAVEKFQLTRPILSPRMQRRDRKILKVVGASWMQTKITAYVLLGISLIGIVVIVMAEVGSYRIIVDDGNYSATVSWRSKTGFKIDFWGQGNDLEELPLGSARAYYTPSLSTVGWSKIEVETSEKYPDWVQAYSAGLLEGSLTWQVLYWHWKNTVEAPCINYEQQCNEIRKIIKDYAEKVRAKARRYSDTNPYWHQITLFYVQLDGLESGWRYAVQRSRQSFEIQSVDFLWLNIFPDISKIENRLNIFRNESQFTLSNIQTVFAKLLDDKNLIIGHNTVGKYSNMLRLLKHYKFNYHHLYERESDLISGTDIIFSSYPGSISSQDDFYMINSNKQNKQHNLIVTSSNINHFNNKVSQSGKDETFMFIGPHAMAINRLSIDAKEWAIRFNNKSHFDSNKQWIAFDFSKLENEENVVWIVENMEVADLTQILLQNKYISSQFYENNNTSSEFYTEENLIEDCLDTNCTLKMMHYNTSIQRNEISIPYGIIDTKTILGNAEGLSEFKAISGPPFSEEILYEPDLNRTDDYVFPFQWSTSEFKNTSHLGHPDIWKFKQYTPKWLWI